MEKTIRSLWMPTAGMLTGARRAAMLLLTTLLLTMTAQTAWAVDVTLSVDNDIAEGNVGHYYVNMPTTGTNTLTLTAEDIAAGKDIFKVYDDGGKSDDYSWYCNGYLVMTAPEGYIIMLEGTVTNSVKDKAKFNVYDGEYNGSGEPSILGANYGSANEAGGIVSHASTGRSMTLYFWSDDWRDKGLNLTVTLINPNTEYHVNCSADSHGEVTACPTSAKALSEITLTANPADGYLLSGINVVASGISVDVDWSIFSNTAKFTMPTSDVTVTPTFTNDLANLSINMPTTGSKSVCVPASISSLKVYDDGGPSGNYTNHNCDGTITLTAPSGYILQMTGTVNSCSKTDGTKVDYLEVYDGADRNAARLGNNQYGLSSGEDIGTLTSSGQSMTLRFYADAYNSYEGLDLTVTLIKVIEYNIKTEDKYKIYLFNYKYYYEEVDDHVLVEIILIFVFVILNGVYNILQLLTIKYLSPNHVLITDIMLAIYESILTTFTDVETNSTTLIFSFILVIINFFALFIYLGIIQLNFWGLNVDI